MASGQSAFLCVYVFALLLAAARDWRTLHIPDAAPLAIVVAYVGFAVAGMAAGRMPATSAGAAVGLSALVFALGMAAFARGWTGGGDVKLLTAASLFAGPEHIADFLLGTALAGGLVGVAAMRPQILSLSDAAKMVTDGRAVPYGPAIAAGGIWTACLLGAGRTI